MTGRNSLHSPIYPGMITPVLLGGVPRMAAILLWTITGVVFRATFLWWTPGIGLLLHGLAYWATKRDPRWMEVTKRYWKTSRYYSS